VLIEKIGSTTNSSPQELNRTNAKMTKYLILELRDFNKNSEKYNNYLLMLTTALLVIGVAQVWVVIWTINNEFIKNGLFIILGVFFFYFTRFMKKINL